MMELYLKHNHRIMHLETNYADCAKDNKFLQIVVGDQDAKMVRRVESVEWQLHLAQIAQKELQEALKQTNDLVQKYDMKASIAEICFNEKDKVISDLKEQMEEMKKKMN
jgi:hypothetical protein